MRPVRVVLPVFALLCAVAASPAMAETATPAAPAAPAASTAAAQPPDTVLRQKIVGSWGQTPACEAGRLTFKADGTFESKGAKAENGVSGTYAIDQGRLSGHNGDNSMPVMLVNFDGDTLLLDNGSGNPQRLDRCVAQ